MDRRGGDRSKPLHTPAIAGGLFSIDRDYFYEVGSYDEGMDIWGGENLEINLLTSGSLTTSSLAFDRKVWGNHETNTPRMEDITVNNNQYFLKHLERHVSAVTSYL